MAFLSKRSSRLRDQTGAAMVELAFVLPVLLIILLGMLDFGKAYHEWIDSTHLANEGARLAAVNYKAPTCSGTNQSTCLAQYIQQDADLSELKNGRPADPGCSGGAGPCYAPAQSKASVCISFPPVSGHTNPIVGDPVLVTVTTNYKWLSYLTSKLHFSTTQIVGKAAMRLEGNPSNYSAGCYP